MPVHGDDRWIVGGLEAIGILAESSMKVTDRLSSIREIVAEILEVDPDELTESSHFIEDHGADSLRAVEILSRLEKKFNVVIPQEELPRMTSLNDTYQVLKENSDWDD